MKLNQYLEYEKLSVFDKDSCIKLSFIRFIIDWSKGVTNYILENNYVEYHGYKMIKIYYIYFGFLSYYIYIVWLKLYKSMLVIKSKQASKKKYLEDVKSRMERKNKG